MTIKCYKFLSNWLSWVVLILMIGTSPIIQAATDCDAVTQISKGECESLLELYNSTDGANWKDNSGWNITNTPCSWRGVSCSNGGVYRIYLPFNNLKGTIPNFSSLPNLRYLSLHNNQLSGSIPDFSALPKLYYIEFNGNQLSGSIPNFSALPNLRYLFLHYNQLSGSIPNFSALPNLSQLYLNSNQLSDSIPNFSHLTNLSYLYIQGNNQLCKDKNTNYGKWQSKVNEFPDCSPIQCNLTINAQNGQVTASPTGPNYDCGSEVELTAKADTGYNFVRWQGAASGTNATTTIKMDDDKTITAIFEAKTYTLSTFSDPENGGSVSRSSDKDSYNHNETVNLTATPKQCYKFTGWSGDCTSSSCQLTMNSDKSVTANFQLETYDLTIQTQGGKVTSNNKVPDSNYNCGSEVTLKAVPDTGYNFVRWEGDASGNDPVITLTMNSNKTIKPIFELKQHSLSISNIQGGSIVIEQNNKDSIYNYGDQVNLTAKPEICHAFTGWSGDCSGTNPKCQITINSDTEVGANFNLKTHTLTTNKENGEVTLDKQGPYNCGTKVKLTATPNIGHHFVRWEGAATGSSNTVEITMDNNKTVTAIFQPNPQTLSISTTSGGSVNPNPNKSPYYYGDEVNLTANPEQCYKFTGWGGACSGNGIHPKCNLEMISDKSVNANFEKQSFRLNINSNNGSIERQPNKTLYDCGQTVKLIARPNQGYKFKAWNGDINSSNESITVNMDADLNITATFEPVTYKLNLHTSPVNLPDVTANSNPSKSDYNFNEPVILTAHAGPNSGYIFDHWEGDIAGTQTTITVVMAQDMNIIAVFKRVDAMNINPSFVEMNLGKPKRLTVSGGVEPYQWSSSNGGQLSPTTGTQVNFSTNIANSEGYKITVTDSRGETSEATIKVYSELKVSPNVITMEIEETKSFDITGGKPPYTISANNGQTSSITYNDNGIFSFNFTAPDTVGNITITVTDALLKEKTIQISVSERAEPLKVTPAGPLSLGVGENIELKASGGQPPYNWTTTNGQLASTGNSTIYIAPQIAGDYSITLTDNMGETVEVKITVVNILKVSPNVISMIIKETESFQITGGKPPYNISVTAGQTSSITDNGNGIFSFNFTAPDTADNITLTVTDALSQQQYVQILVSEAPEPLEVTPIGPLTLLAGQTIELIALKGQPPYNWTVTNGQLTSIQGNTTTYIAPQIAGDYTITLTDDMGEKLEIKITVFLELKVSLNVTTMEIEETKSFEITGGKSPYTISVNKGQTSSITDNGNGIFSFNFTTPDTAGNITLTVTDALSQQQSVQILVEAPEPLKATPSGPLTLSFGESIELTASGGRSPYNWTITGGQLTSTQGSNTTYIAPKIAGDYTITLTDNKGEKAEVEIKVIAELVCSPTLVTVILGDPNPVTFKAAGGAEPYKWSADNGPVNPIEGPETNYQPPAQSGEYHVTCKDKKDNSITSIVRVVPSLAITPAQIDLATGGVATLQVTGGQQPYTWIAEAGDLSNTSGSRVSYTAPTRNGVYSVTVTDALKQEAKARIQVLGNIIISPIKTVVTIGENISLSAARGAEPYTWPDGSTGRTWNTKYTTVGRQEVVVTDAAGDSGLAIVEVIHAELGLTPQTASLHPNEVVNFFVTGGTSPYAWSAEAGTLSNLQGQRVGYVAPEQPGEYTITVADGRDKIGQAKVTITAGVTDSSGNLQTNRGAIRSGIIIDGVAHHSDHILTDAGAHIEISFPLTMPNDGQEYNTYGAILWTPPQAEPVFLFRTTNIVNPFQVFDGATFPVYQATAAGNNVVIDIYRGALNGLSGQFDFYAGYAPTTATNVLDNLLFNSKPFSLEVK